MEIRKLSGNYTMVEMSPEEASDLVGSLAVQLRCRNPNADRPEFRSNEGRYISFAVSFPPPYLPKKEGGG